MATAELESHILSVCSALGGTEDFVDTDSAVSSSSIEGAKLQRRYVLGDECIDCLRDLKRFLRYDEVNRDKIIAKLLGRWQILQKDLLPILAQHNENHLIATGVVELLVPLTWPFDELGNIKRDATLIEYLQDYKEAFINSSALHDVLRLMMRMLSTPFRQRSDRDTAILRLMLYLFRNLLAIPDPEASATSTLRTALRARMQETLISKLHSTQIIEFFLTVCSSISSERQFHSWNTLMVEMMRWLFGSFEPATLLASEQRVDVELADMLTAEDEKKRQLQRSTHTRHTRFGGTISLKLDDGSKLNLHRQSARQIERALDVTKKNYHNRYALKADDTDVRKRHATVFSPAVLALVRETAQSFLESGFNPLVASVKKDIDMERGHIREMDIVNFTLVIQFMLEYQRGAYSAALKRKLAADAAQTVRYVDDQLPLTDSPTATDEPVNELEPVSFNLLAAVLDVRGMTFLVKTTRSALEQKLNLKLQTTLACWKHMLLSLDLMQTSSDDAVKQVAEDVQNNLYYDHSSLELIVALLRAFKGQSRTYLHDLVETTHVMMRLLESFVKNKGSVVVKRRARGRRTADAAEDKEGGIATEVVDGSEFERPDFVEREFDLTSFERTFANEAVLATYMASLRDFDTLHGSFIHMITKMFHRIAVKCNQYPLFFKLTTLDLLNRIMQAKDTMSGGAYHRELYEFIEWITRRFFKRYSEYPMLLLEVFFTKRRSDCFRIMYGRKLEEDGEPSSRQARDWDSDDEILVRPGFSLQSQVAIAASALVTKSDQSLVIWLSGKIRELAPIQQERQQAAGLDPDLPTVQEEQVLTTDDPSIQEAMQKNKEFRLLLSLVGFVRRPAPSADGEGDSDSAPAYVLPADVDASDFADHAPRLDGCLVEPLTHNGKPAYKLLKRKPRRRNRHKGGTRRQSSKAGPMADKFITDSDAELADEDEDAFFARERELRQRTAEKHEQMMASAVQTLETERRKGKTKKTRDNHRQQLVQSSSDGSGSSSDSDTGEIGEDQNVSKPDSPEGNSDSSDSDVNEDNASANDEFAMRILALRRKRQERLQTLQANLSAATSGSRTRPTSKRRAEATAPALDEDPSPAAPPAPLASSNASQSQKRRRIITISDDDNDADADDDEQSNKDSRPNDANNF
ncbi:Topoisomerase 1-associated factor 1 [Sorochytrium milnesiophthora]